MGVHSISLFDYYLWDFPPYSTKYYELSVILCFISLSVYEWLSPNTQVETRNAIVWFKVIHYIGWKKLVINFYSVWIITNGVDEIEAIWANILCSNLLYQQSLNRIHMKNIRGKFSLISYVKKQLYALINYYLTVKYKRPKGKANRKSVVLKSCASDVLSFVVVFLPVSF